MMKALVTGGGGFLGLTMVKRLQMCGLSVRSYSRLPHSSLGELGVEQISGDLADMEAVSAAVAGCDVVFHVAAKAGVWGPYDDYYRTNVIGTQNVITACRRHKVSRLVYTSSPSVIFNGKDMEGADESTPYPRSYSAHYPKTKAEAEQLVEVANDYALATVSLRPHLIWGPGDSHLLPRLAARAQAGQLRRIGHQRKFIDTTYIDNAADAHILAADRLFPGSPVAGNSYFISQGEPMELWEMINQLLQAAGLPPVQRTIPKSLALMFATFFEVLHKLTRNHREPRLTRFVVKELTTSHWFDISAARRDLNYVPAVSTEEGLRRLEAAWPKF